MPTGIIQDKYLSRILSVMRHEEQRLVELHLNERLIAEPKTYIDLKGRDESKPMFEVSWRGKTERKTYKDLNREYKLEAMFGDSWRPIPKRKGASRDQDTTLIHTRQSELHLIHAMRQVLLDEGIPLSKIPVTVRPPEYSKRGEYQPAFQTIRLKPLTLKDIPGDRKATSVAETKERIRFAIAEFALALIHETRHFEQHWKGDYYKTYSKKKEKLDLNEHRKWCVENSRDARVMDSGTANLDLGTKIDRLAKTDLRVALLHYQREKQEGKDSPEPIDYQSWKELVFFSDEKRASHFGKAYDILSDRKFRQQFPKEVAIAEIKKKKLTDTKDYSDFMKRQEQKKAAWIEKQFKEDYKLYEQNLRQLSKIKPEAHEKALNIIFEPKQLRGRRMLYLSAPKEMDAHRAQFSLLRRYLPGDQFLKFLQESGDIRSYSWIRKLIAQKDSKDKTLTALDATWPLHGSDFTDSESKTCK